MYGKALSSMLLGLVCLGSAFLNRRPVTEAGMVFTLAVGILSSVLAGFTIKDIWQRQDSSEGPWLALLGGCVLVGVGLAFLGVYVSLGMHVSEEATVQRMLLMNDLKHLALAMSDYEQAHGRLPPTSISNRDGKPLLSWRVLLLPYLEQNDLYQQFRLDDPWDGPANIPLLDRMPKVYAHRKRPSASLTYFQVLVGKGAAFEPGQRLCISRDFPDGAADTFLIVEATDAVPWTKPDDLAFEADKPLPAMGGISARYFPAAMADGSVRTIWSGIPEPTLRALITRNANDKPGADWDQ